MHVTFPRNHNEKQSTHAAFDRHDGSYLQSLILRVKHTLDQCKLSSFLGLAHSVEKYSLGRRSRQRLDRSPRIAVVQRKRWQLHVVLKNIHFRVLIPSESSSENIFGAKPAGFGMATMLQPCRISMFLTLFWVLLLSSLGFSASQGSSIQLQDEHLKSLLVEPENQEQCSRDVDCEDWCKEHGGSRCVCRCPEWLTKGDYACGEKHKHCQVANPPKTFTFISHANVPLRSQDLPLPL